MLLASILQIVAEALLQFTGFFRSLAYNGAAVAAAMIGATVFAYAAGFDLVEFLALYAAIYAAGAVGLAIAAVYGPIRAAAGEPADGRPLTAFSEPSAAHRDRQQPHQPGKAERAKHRRRPEILDAADVVVLLARDVIGEFLDPGVEEFDGQDDEYRADHRANHAAFGARTNASGIATTRSTGFVAQGGSVLKPSRSPRSEFRVALKSRFKVYP